MTSGCALSGGRIDPDLVARARASAASWPAVSSPARQGLYERDAREYDPIEEEVEEEEHGSVFVAELLAIFPGFFVHGLGHTYAGDRETARRLRRMGEWGWAFTAVGAGAITGAYFADRSSDGIFPISLYVAGGAAGGVGVGYLLSAWVMDIYDTPRAVRSGGRPWRFLQKAGDAFDD